MEKAEKPENHFHTSKEADSVIGYVVKEYEKNKEQNTKLVHYVMKKFEELELPTGRGKLNNKTVNDLSLNWVFPGHSSN